MNSLQGMLKCRPVPFGEDTAAHLDQIPRRDANDQSIEGAMVNRAHRDAIRNDGLTTLGVFLDMCCIQES